MLRLGGVLSKTRDYDSEYNEESIITKDEFDFLNDLTSVIPLSAGFLATDLEGFGSFLIELSFLCFPVEKIEDSLSTLLHEFLYPNLMYLFPSIARNYKENIRAVLKPQQDHRGFELSGIITRFKQNNRNYSSNRTALETIKQDQEDNKRLFDLKFGDNMLGNENLQTMQSAFDKKKIKLLKTADQTTKIQSIYDSPLGKTINALDERRKAENLKKEEKLKRWEEKKKMLEIMRLKYEREAAQTYGFKGKILKIGFYCTKCCYLLTKFCKEGPSRLTGKISKGLKNLGKRLGFKDDEELMDGELEKLKVRKEAPSWQEIVDLMISTMVSAEKEYNAQMEKNLILHFNLSNILALFGKVFFYIF